MTFTNKKKVVSEFNKAGQSTAQPVNEDIHYKGSVEIVVRNRKNKIVYSNKNHNAGGSTLFEYLAACLRYDTSGQEKDFATNNRPKYVVLFDRDTSDGKTPKTATIDTKSHAITAGILYNAISAINDYGDTGTGKSITLHFTIPCSELTLAANAGIFQIGLYNGKNAEIGSEQEKENYCAYYNLTEDGETWDPIISEDIDVNYTIFIQWTLAII